MNLDPRPFDPTAIIFAIVILALFVAVMVAQLN